MGSDPQTSFAERSLIVARASAVLLLITALAVPLQAQTPGVQGPDGPVVMTSGEGVVRRAPDRAWAHVSVESRARTPQEAQRANAATMKTVLQKLGDAGFKDDAIQTRGYDLQPEYDFKDGRQIPRGYLARNTIEVRADDLSRIGEVLDVAVSAGATSVGSIRFDLKDRDAAEREALRLAVDDARRRAEAAASAVGMTIDRIVRIEEQRLRQPPPMPLMMAERAASSDAAPPVQPGEIEVRAAVAMTASIR